MGVKLSGIIPATVLPMDEDYDPDLPALRKYLRWLLEFRGLGGLALNVDTGEGLHLSREERKQVLEAAVAENSGKVPLIAGLFARYTQEAIELAKDAERAGADALLVPPPPAFAGDPLPVEMAHDYHLTVAEESGLPIVLFQLQPALGGRIYSEEVLKRLLDIEGVVAIKDASFDARVFLNTIRILENHSRKVTMLTGNDNFIFESFVLGARGALIGFGTIATDLQIEMLKAVSEGEEDRAREIWERLLPLVDAIFCPPVRNYRARLKHGLARLGVLKNSLVRPPLPQLPAEEARGVEVALSKVGLVR